MAEVKKTPVKPVATVKPVAAVKPVEEVKAAAPVKKEEAKKAPAKKETVKKETAKKAPAKKEAAKTEKKTTKKAAAKSVVNIQFAGKSYATDELVKIAQDVWKYDLGMKAEEFKTVDLYVKPEENLVYYVINGEVTGNFAI